MARHLVACATQPPCRDGWATRRHCRAAAPSFAGRGRRLSVVGFGLEQSLELVSAP